jgi:hypothetical protein
MRPTQTTVAKVAMATPAATLSPLRINPTISVTTKNSGAEAPRHVAWIYVRALLSEGGPSQLG